MSKEKQTPDFQVYKISKEEFEKVKNESKNVVDFLYVIFKVAKRIR